MAKNIFIGVNNVAKKPKNIYVGVDGKARRVKEVFIGVNGIARKCWPSSVLPNSYTQLEYIDMCLGMVDSNATLNARIIVSFSLARTYFSYGATIFYSQFGANSETSDELVYYRADIPQYGSTFEFAYFKQVLGRDNNPYSQVYYSNTSEGLLSYTDYTIDFLNGNNTYLYNSEGYYSISSHNLIGSFTKQTPKSGSTKTTSFFGPGFGSGNGSIGKAYYMKIYNGSTLIRDFYPCYRNSDKYLGYYDTVNKIFYPAYSGGRTITYETAISNNYLIGPIV